MNTLRTQSELFADIDQLLSPLQPHSQSPLSELIEDYFQSESIRPNDSQVTEESIVIQPNNGLSSFLSLGLLNLWLSSIFWFILADFSLSLSVTPVPHRTFKPKPLLLAGHDDDIPLSLLRVCRSQKPPLPLPGFKSSPNPSWPTEPRHKNSLGSPLKSNQKHSQTSHCIPPVLSYDSSCASSMSSASSLLVTPPPRFIPTLRPSQSSASLTSRIHASPSSRTTLTPRQADHKLYERMRARHRHDIDLLANYPLPSTRVPGLGSSPSWYGKPHFEHPISNYQHHPHPTMNPFPILGYHPPNPSACSLALHPFLPTIQHISRELRPDQVAELEQISIKAYQVYLHLNFMSFTHLHRVLRPLNFLIFFSRFYVHFSGDENEDWSRSNPSCKVNGFHQQQQQHQPSSAK